MPEGFGLIETWVLKLPPYEPFVYDNTLPQLVTLADFSKDISPYLDVHSGYLLQWGRSLDGHQYPNSRTTEVRSFSLNDSRYKQFFYNVSAYSTAKYSYSNQHEYIPLDAWSNSSSITQVCPSSWHVASESDFNALDLQIRADYAADYTYHPYIAYYNSPLRMHFNNIRIHSRSRSALQITQRFSLWTSSAETSGGTTKLKKFELAITPTSSVIKNINPAPSSDTTYQLYQGLPVRCVKDQDKTYLPKYRKLRITTEPVSTHLEVVERVSGNNVSSFKGVYTLQIGKTYDIDAYRTVGGSTEGFLVNPVLKVGPHTGDVKYYYQTDLTFKVPRLRKNNDPAQPIIAATTRVEEIDGGKALKPISYNADSSEVKYYVDINKEYLFKVSATNYFDSVQTQTFSASTALIEVRSLLSEKPGRITTYHPDTELYSGIRGTVLGGLQVEQRPDQSGGTNSPAVAPTSTRPPNYIYNFSPNTRYSHYLNNLTLSTTPFFDTVSVLSSHAGDSVIFDLRHPAHLVLESDTARFPAVKSSGLVSFLYNLPFHRELYQWDEAKITDLSTGDLVPVVRSGTSGARYVYPSSGSPYDTLTIVYYENLKYGKTYNIKVPVREDLVSFASESNIDADYTVSGIYRNGGPGGTNYSNTIKFGVRKTVKITTDYGTIKGAEVIYEDDEGLRRTLLLSSSVVDVYYSYVLWWAANYNGKFKVKCQAFVPGHGLLDSREIEISADADIPSEIRFQSSDF